MTTLACDPARWLRRFHPSDQAAVRLVCFPHAGGASTYYFPVSRTLSPSIEVIAVQYPGRQDRRFEPPIGDVHTLADHVVAALGPVASQPLALFGHSLGAMVAFEVARRLEDAGSTPLGLFASGRRAPSCYRAEFVHTYDDARLIFNMKALSGTDSRLLDDAEFLRSVLPTLRSDYKAAETYQHRPGPPLRCPIVTLAGDQDSMVTQEEAAQWRQHTSGSFRLEMFPGGHFYLDAHAARVMRLISELVNTWFEHPSHT